MSRSIQQHPAERLVTTYLKKLRNTSNTRPERQVLAAASKLIHDVLTNCCCDTVTIVSAVLTMLNPRDSVVYTFCGMQVSADDGNEPDLAEYLAGAFNALKITYNFPGTFTFNNVTRTITYTGDICIPCADPHFIEDIQPGNNE